MRTLRIAVCGLAASFLAMAVLAGCGVGGDDKASDEQIAKEREDAADQARQEERLHQLEEKLKESERQNGQSKGSDRRRRSGGAAPVSRGNSCGGGISVGPNTTCAFARVVRDEYIASGQTDTIEATSPATGQTYTMFCSSGSPHVCTGGNNASVYFP